MRRACGNSAGSDISASTCGVNETGLQLILSLLLEVEQLREE